jgi:deazaflavin-dependent oxidoreductase (nitroreductase family)
MPDVNDWNAQTIAEFRANAGRVGGPFEGAPVALVHHRGRKSAREYVTPMMYLANERDDNTIYVFATKGGARTNPDWYFNLTAAGEGSIERGTETYGIAVREVTGDERDRIYDEQAQRYPGFAEYAEKTAGIRTIPVLELQRAGTIDDRHLLLVGAGPGLGMAVARRFAVGGYRVTLLARSTDGLGNLARSLADTGAEIDTTAADASDGEDLRARITQLYQERGAPGLIVYNAAMGAPDQLLSSSVAHLQEAYAVDVLGAIVVAQVAAPAMRAAGFGTIIVTGGGFADHPIPVLASLSLGKAALRSAATMLGADLEPDGVRVATLTIDGQIVADTAFDPARIAERYWEVVHSDGPWQTEVRFTGD